MVFRSVIVQTISCCCSRSIFT